MQVCRAEGARPAVAHSRDFLSARNNVPLFHESTLKVTIASVVARCLVAGRAVVLEKYAQAPDRRRPDPLYTARRSSKDRRGDLAINHRPQGSRRASGWRCSVVAASQSLFTPNFRESLRIPEETDGTVDNRREVRFVSIHDFDYRQSALGAIRYYANER